MENAPPDTTFDAADRRQHHLKQLATLGLNQVESIREYTQRLIEAGGSPAEVMQLTESLAAMTLSVRQTIALSVQLDRMKASPQATRTQRIWATKTEPERRTDIVDLDEVLEQAPRRPRLN